MGLVITTHVGDSFYLVLTEDLKKGNYIEVKIISSGSEITYGNSEINASSSIREYITAPRSVLILREIHINKEGGLEVLTEKIKDGNFSDMRK